MSGGRLHWLHGCTGSHDRLASGRPAAGTAWQSGGSAAAAGGPATASSPAGQRRPTGGPEAAGSARQSWTGVRRQRTRRDRILRHGPLDRRAAMITAIVVTVDIVARLGAAGMSERPAQRVRQQCRFVDDEP